jgi:hypothetical protein
MANDPNSEALNLNEKLKPHYAAHSKSSAE